MIVTPLGGANTTIKMSLRNFTFDKGLTKKR